MIRSRVEGENPVVRHSRIPPARRAAKTSSEWERRDLSAVDGLVERGLEGDIGLLGAVAVASEDLGEDRDLGLTHGASDVGSRVVHQVAGHQTDGVQRGLEGLLDRHLVGDGGAGHVEGGQSDRWGHGARSSQVSSAMAGERVIPRPAGPVTTTIPVSIVVR